MSAFIPDFTFKICVFGDGGVGKTTLVNRFLTGMFKMDTMMTLGANILVKHVNLDDKLVALQIWDFGGEEMYRPLLSAYAMGSSAGLVMYDITRTITLHHAILWLKEFRKAIKDDKIPLILIGGKLDLEDKRSVSNEEALDFAEKHNFYGYIECSSKTGENVDCVFKKITNKLLKELSN